MAGDEVTVRALWAATTDAVGSRHEARWLVETATACSGADLDADLDAVLDQPVTVRMVAHLDSMVARYRAGEPLQYVLGRWGFRRLDLAVDGRVLIPRPETELVAQAAIDLARQRPPVRRIADLGTGSGAIGLSIADELPIDGTEVWITDASEAALAVASANLAGLGRAARNVRVAAGDWFEALPDDVAFDVIVSNPPYVAEGSPMLDRSVVEWEPGSALYSGADGLDAIRHLIAGAPRHLAEQGWLVLEIGADQGAIVSELLMGAGYAESEVRADLAGHPRIAIGRRPDQ